MESFFVAMESTAIAEYLRMSRWTYALVNVTHILGIALLVSVISLRKHISRLSFGTFSGWRIVHVVAGALAAGILIAHTGLRLGDNLNLLLILTFLALLAVGSVASGAIGLQHILPRTAARRTREVSLWLHILLLWPLPAFLGFHIFKTYWF